jgi:hypothetical protein
MVKALFDTNILVDYLNAVPQARTELRRYTEKAVSNSSPHERSEMRGPQETRKPGFRFAHPGYACC